MMTVDDLHARLRRKVDSLFAMELMTEEDREWRFSSLKSLYADYGIRADEIRGVKVSATLAGQFGVKVSPPDNVDDEGDLGGSER